MAFVTIDSSTLDVGDPLKKDLFDKIKSNEDDLDLRVGALETSSSKVNFMEFYLLNASSFPTATGLYYYRANQNFTITEAQITIYEKGSLSGTIEIDIKKSTTNQDNASFTTIFTTKPSILYSAVADYASSTNKVFDSGMISVNAGDWLRLDITSTPTGGVLPKLQISAYGE